MRVLQYYFFVLCVCLVFLLPALFVSCKDTGADNPSLGLAVINETTPEPAAEASGLDMLADDIGEISKKPDFLILDMDDEPDLILVSYLDPELQEGVECFFRDLTGSLDVARAVLAGAAANDIPPALAFALCYEESRYNPRAFNRNRNETVDRGLFQLNSASFPKLTVEDFYDSEVNATYGLTHLRWCLDNAGTEVAGLAMYNAGHTRVRSSGTPKNTLDYISRILKRQRKIEEFFMTEYTHIAQTKIDEKEKKVPFRLSLLMPLGHW